MKITLDIKRAVIVRGLGPDKISLTLRGAPPPFPAMPDNEAELRTETVAGLGVSWCRDVLGIEPDEVIDARSGTVTGRHTGG